ncbi:tripartite tricarboxylate transporter permease [Chelatococcus sambhunathii]|uniref:Tripartite tricarboxylate transporter permease n=1 Tax=Chelatococcus sambhunathii TaxID=363953 RepID=A0ABU1DGR9_9HYPH|nr:tripartite tricarboxylate transporter permease [Chelatococcus sambhunathii]MDR4307282.1 tripartite tricarboxylate transporter permease [Chelatococcus sambhunathii]
MTDILVQLGNGFLACLHPTTMLMLVVGIIVGLLVGVLPGLTLVMGVVLFLPFTYKMQVTDAIVLLSAMYVSGTYGGAFTSILFRIPGEPIHVPLLWDGYAMARKGKPAQALGWTLIAAFVGGLLSAVAMVLLTKPVASFALRFSSPEYFAILVFGLTSVIALGSGSLANALISLALGLLIASVGTDAIYGAERFTFGMPIFADGIEFLVVMVGAYGVGEVLTRLERGFSSKPLAAVATTKTKLPSLGEIGAVKSMLLRSTVIGHIVGLIPGAGATVAAFVSYGVEKQFGRKRAEMGSGVVEGIVAPQSAATASVGGALIPLLALGIPGSGATAVILGAFMLHGIQPGPQIMATSSAMVYTIFASIFIGIAVMCLMGYFAIRPLVKILDFPESIVSAFVMLFCFVGALAIRSNVTDLWLMIGFGALGYLFERYGFPIAPLVLGVILGPLAEESFMNSMISFSNDWTVFFTRPISGTVMALAILTLSLPIIGLIRNRRKPGASLAAAPAAAAEPNKAAPATAAPRAVRP